MKMSSNRLKTTRAWKAALSTIVVALGASFAQTGPLTLPVGRGPEGITVAPDGSTLCVWVANQFSNTVTKLRARDGVILGTFPVGNRPVNVVATIGSTGSFSIWVTNNRSNTVTKLRALDGT